MIIMRKPIFCDPMGDKVLPVIELFDSLVKLDKHHCYLIGEYVYHFVGNSNFSNHTPGIIYKYGDKYYVNDHDEETKDLYHQNYIINEDEYGQRMVNDSSMEDMAMQYIINYIKGNNIILSGNIKITPSGEVYMPALSPDDDPLERVTKLMLRHSKLILNGFRGQFDKKHGLDNIKSALNGATKNMSIIKFMSWCDIFGWEWEISWDNINQDVPHPIRKPITINKENVHEWNDEYTKMENTKKPFTVKFLKDEDPLKRGIKIVLLEKRIDIAEYRHKSPTPHLLNNMISALKTKQKMTIKYAMNWAEILDLEASFKIINPEDGIWYKITGFDNMTTNDTEME